MNDGPDTVVWLPFEPQFIVDADRDDFIIHAKPIAQAATLRDPRARLSAVEEVRASLVRQRSRPALTVAARAAALVLADLVAQGWSCRVRRRRVRVSQPVSASELGAERERLRHQLHVDRDRQLHSDAVRLFIAGMERRRLHNGSWVSVYSLMRDGAELAGALRRLCAGAMTCEAVQRVINPYLQVVGENAKCEYTGIPLGDVWRYFRHTWANAYRSVPGRSMMFLVRDAAAPCHPIVGIGALSSSAVQIGVRDEWLGWSAESYVDYLTHNATDRHVEWLSTLISDGIRDIYLDDFLDPSLGPLTRQLISSPSSDVLSWLDAFAAENRREHERLGDAAEHKRRSSKTTGEDDHWRTKAEMPLFRSKRAETLAILLRARLAVNSLGVTPQGSDLREALSRPHVRQALQAVIRRAKSDRVGVAIADISVCGSIAPYSSLLGGKLVAMLMMSPEAILAYRERYARSESVIASSLAGRAIVRQPHLVFLGTTSLYGTEPTQYTRVHVPCERLGGRRGESLRYRLLGRTEGYGSLQFSAETVEALSTLVSQRENGQRVRSIFGEGVNPRLRKIREGLDALALPSDELLTHGSARLVYGVALATNFREYLLGLETEPAYYAPLQNVAGATSAMTQWWRERWLAPRLNREEALLETARHRLTHPIRHGARVSLPTAAGDQISLFDDLAGADG